MDVQAEKPKPLGRIHDLDGRDRRSFRHGRFTGIGHLVENEPPRLDDRDFRQAVRPDDEREYELRPSRSKEEGIAAGRFGAEPPVDFPGLRDMDRRGFENDARRDLETMSISPAWPCP